MRPLFVIKVVRVSMAAAAVGFKRGFTEMNAAGKVKTVLGTMAIPKPLDRESVVQVLGLFSQAGHCDLDTAIMYQGGLTEEALGSVGVSGLKVACKANPWYPTVTTLSGGLKPETLKEQLCKSLSNLKLDKCSLFYLHAPDPDMPIDDTLRAVHELHQEGLFDEWGLSNFAAWQVADIYHRCCQKGISPPSVYQGMYNAVTRNVESELFPALRTFNIRFYAYNPLAGGILSGIHSFEDAPKDGRFNVDSIWGQRYRERFWHKAVFDAVDELKRLCKTHNTTMVSASLRWLYYHSHLIAELGDAVIIGGSCVKHCKENIDASVENGPLPEDIVKAFDEAAKAFKPLSPSYFRWR